ncbi:MAG: right-handed parallel beta-helix repeat-containing protein [Verrucomicrobia bacterium]|nr:right-handed parallel beta-helix repeat-containing protein [Verrucomicrobiota bacterium]
MQTFKLSAGTVLAASAGILFLQAGRCIGADAIVAPSGGDFTSIQQAIDQAAPGDTVRVRDGVYYEKVVFSSGGSAGGGYVSLRAYDGEHPVLDGTGVAGQSMVVIQEHDYIRIEGFEIRNNSGVTDGSGIRLLGACQHIQIVSNEIHEMRGSNAMGITLYGTNSTPASDILVQGNHVHHCDPATSEAIVLNGNINGFEVSGNLVHDVNNIGIDFIGGETDISPYGICRNGVCRGNHVYKARSAYGGGYAGGIYVDGAQNILIEDNMVHECDLGIEIGAENSGFDSTGIVVRSNRVFNNDKVGIVFGGFEQAVGRVRGCRFENNVCYKNDTLQDGNGELWIQFASNNIVENNIFFCGPQDWIVVSWEGNSNNSLDYNLYFSASGDSNDATFVWNGTEHNGFQTYRSGTGQDAHSKWTDPQFVDAAATNFHIANTSPAVDAGNPSLAFSSTVKDMDGQSRVMGGIVDTGSDEVSHYWKWQQLVFGGIPDFQTNSGAVVYSPQGDYDGDHGPNYLEMISGTSATSSGSVFRIGIKRGDQPTHVDLVFPVRTQRLYSIEKASDPTGAWSNRAGPSAVALNDDAYTLSDAASAVAGVYRVGISE